MISVGNRLRNRAELDVKVCTHSNNHHRYRSQVSQQEADSVVETIEDTAIADLRSLVDWARESSGEEETTPSQGRLNFSLALLAPVGISRD